MSALMFHNDTVNLNSLWYDSHASMLKAVCLELGHPDKIDEMMEKFLGKKMKMKTYKNPNKPKRPKSAYFFFCDEKRPALLKNAKKGNAKVDIAEISKELSKLWKACSESKRKKYSKLNEADKKRYETEMQQFSETG